MSEPLVVIGNGMAAARFVEELRCARSAAMRIAVVGEEPRLAYNRVLLSSVLAGEVAAVRHRAKARALVARPRHHAALRARRRPRSIAERAASRSPAGVDAALRPGWCSPPARGRSGCAIPGMRLAGVLTFRDLGDVAAIARAAARGTTAVVIGGGLLGLEAAYGLANARRARHARAPDGPADGAPARRARGRHAAARGRGEGHRGPAQRRDRRASRQRGASRPVLR